MHDSKKEAIQTALPKLLRDVREWCESQAELWQRVPNLALEANGRSGYLDDYSYCYSYGFWRIWDSSPRGQYYLCSVDCATGVIAYDAESFRQARLVVARDRDVLHLLDRLDEIDAELVIARLEEHIATPQSEFIAKSNPTWPSKQEKLRQQVGLGYDRPYVRAPWPTRNQ
ncbi:MAG: hypothetical protein E6Q36_06770 [Chryseobacterium sp.]|nr:MAG: hypothetical protein E6Q36_06770 [Chryseobacterium sp.]